MKAINRIFFTAPLIIILTFAVLSRVAEAVLPFTVKQGHPRIYLDAARVNEIHAASLATIPLNGMSFPQNSGTLTFDIKPIAKTDPSQSVQSIFDGYDTSRNHVFVRHIDQIDPNTGNTYCGTDPADQVNLCMQVAFQPSMPVYYIAAKNFILTSDKWWTLSVSWNSNTHTASLQYGATSVTMNWLKDSNNIPYDWYPSDQEFVFKGRDSLDNIRLYNSDTPSPSNLMVNFPMSEGAGRITWDTSGYAVKALLSDGVSWGTRSVGNTDLFIQFNGQSNAQLRIKPDSILTSAWQDTYAEAEIYASSLNSNVSPVDLSTGHPDTIAKVAHEVGLAWMVTGEDRFRTAGLKYAELLVAVPVTDGGEYSQSGRVEGMGILYDWFFSVVSTTMLPDGRIYGDALADAVTRTLTVTSASVQMIGEKICGPGQYVDPVSLACSGGFPPTIEGSTIGGHAHGDNHKTAVALLAMFDEHPEFESLLAAIHYNFVNGFEPARAWICVDGGHHMGWAYAGEYTYLLPAKASWRIGKGSLSIDISTDCAATP